MQSEVEQFWNLNTSLHARQAGTSLVLYCGRFVKELWSHFSQSAWNLVDCFIIFCFLGMVPLRAYLAAKCVRKEENHPCGLEILADADDLQAYKLTLNIVLCFLVLACFLRSYIMLVSEQVTGVLIIALFKMFDDIFVYVLIQVSHGWQGHSHAGRSVSLMG